MTASVLIVDDEPDIRELVSLTISRMGLDCHTAANLSEAANLLEHYQFAVCLTDMRLPDGNGVDFVREVKVKHPDLPVAVITAHGNMEAAVDAMKNGAFDFVSKPVDIVKLRNLVTTAVANRSKTAANEETIAGKTATDNTTEASPAKSTANISQSAPRAPATEKISTEKTASEVSAVVKAGSDALAGTESIIGHSPAITNLKQMVLKLAKSNAPVWISGESGTGKELTARMIHQNSARAKHSFVPINCGAIPCELMESELFGHKKGSFTGAIADHDGLFLQADGGTLFLDEVAELPLTMQVKLLRTIQEKTIRPVGSAKEFKVDVRILSASHKDLAAEVEAARFRHDLFYRLNVISLLCPSLRQRPQDIRELAGCLLERLSAGSTDTGASPYEFTESAIEALSAYSFPGNVRELENIIERTLAITDSRIIDTQHLQLDQAYSQASAQAAAPYAGRTSDQRDSQSMTELQSTEPQPGTKDSAVTNKQLANSPERILAALESNRWNRKAAARELGLTYRQLRYRIEQIGIDKKD